MEYCQWKVGMFLPATEDKARMFATPRPLDVALKVLACARRHEQKEAIRTE